MLSPEGKRQAESAQGWWRALEELCLLLTLPPKAL